MSRTISRPRANVSLESWQEEGRKFAHRAWARCGGCALYFEQGTGKTFITLGLIEDTRPETVLIVCRLTNKESTWVKNLVKYFPYYQICRTWQEFKDAKGGKRILLVHWQALSKSVRKRVSRFAFDLVVIDEGQDIKQRASAASRFARSLNRQRRRLLLTGTPIDKSPKDVWAQIRFVDPQALGERWQDFEDEFMIYRKVDMKKARPGSMLWQEMQFWQRINKRKMKFNDRKMDELIRRIKHCALRVTSEVLDLDPVEFIDVPVSMFGEQRRLYEKMERDFVIERGEIVASAGLKITQIAKLHQICNGHLIDDEGDVHEAGQAKLRAFRRVLRDVKYPFVVFCKYREDIAIIEETLEQLGISHKVIHGGIKDKKRVKHRTDTLASFQRGELDALVCQIRTGGVGVDLFAASDAIIYSCTHSYIDYDQAIKRLQRYGQTRSVRIFRIYIQNSIDKDHYSAVEQKCSVNEMFLDRLKRRRYNAS